MIQIKFYKCYTFKKSEDFISNLNAYARIFIGDYRLILLLTYGDYRYLRLNPNEK